MNRGQIFLEFWLWLIDRMEDEQDARERMYVVSLALSEGLDKGEEEQYQALKNALRSADALELDLIAENIKVIMRDTLYYRIADNQLSDEPAPEGEGEKDTGFTKDVITEALFDVDMEPPLIGGQDMTTRELAEEIEYYELHNQPVPFHLRQAWELSQGSDIFKASPPRNVPPFAFRDFVTSEMR